MLPRRAEINIYLLKAENIFPGISYTLHFISATNAWWPLYSTVLNIKQSRSAWHCLECMEASLFVASQNPRVKEHEGYWLGGHLSLTPCTASRKAHISISILPLSVHLSWVQHSGPLFPLCVGREMGLILHICKQNAKLRCSISKLSPKQQTLWYN